MSYRNIILLHTCCGPCASACAERLRTEGYEPLLFFSNSNISPPEEFRKRAEHARKLARTMNLPLIIDPYRHEAWLAHIRGHEDAPEKGSRCRLCFDFALGRTAEWAAKLDLKGFTTTLTVSPHKVSRVLFECGRQYDRFVPIDFKKKDGFKRSLELSAKHELYRQDYCGCEFSIKT